MPSFSLSTPVVLLVFLLLELKFKRMYNINNNVTEGIVCVQGHDPLTFSFLMSFLFFDLVGVLWP